MILILVIKIKSSSGMGAHHIGIALKTSDGIKCDPATSPRFNCPMNSTIQMQGQVASLTTPQTSLRQMRFQQSRKEFPKMYSPTRVVVRGDKRNFGEVKGHYHPGGLVGSNHEVNIK